MARILIVEDNHANMKLACLLLRNAGHTVLCAIDAETGLTLARSDQPDLILMDIQLPGMDGLAATALLKQDPRTAAIPVIALTAMAMKADQEKTRVAGCDAYIAKPLRYQELYAVVDSLLDITTPNATSAANAAASPALAPLPSARGQTESGSPSHDRTHRDRPLILVAEDNETNQKVIGRQLALLGVAADFVGNGRLALERWQQGDYALLLSDLQMPEMDGYELIEAIRAQEQASERLPIIIMSASASKREANRYRTPDMDEYLSKPLQLLELKAALATWLPTMATDGQAQVDAKRRPMAAQAVDLAILENLFGNDPLVIQEFLGDFRASAKKISLELIDACANGQSARAGDQAHKLMSSARAMGALALGDLCETMETAGRAGRGETLLALIPMFEAELDAVNDFIEALPVQDAVLPNDG
jgi:CheY-like chemotaxis protein/HPt (histidine-containing phosphotransfer) domain-containing protein